VWHLGLTQMPHFFVQTDLRLNNTVNSRFQYYDLQQSHPSPTLANAHWI